MGRKILEQSEQYRRGSLKGSVARAGRSASILSAVGGFALTLLLLHAAFDLPPRIEGYSDKIAFFEENADRYSVLFVGSSRVFRHAVPAAFDEAAAESGLQVRSFNLGVDALTLIELKTLLEAIARLGSGSPRYVLIEPALGVGLHARNVATIRAAYFRDLDNTMVEISAMHSMSRQWLSIGRSLRACLNHYAFVGRLASGLLPPVTEPSRTLLADDLVSARGFMAQDSGGPSLEDGPWRRHLLQNFDRIARRVRERPGPSESVVRKFAPRNEILVDAARQLREAGSEPLFFISPIMQVSDPLRAFEAFHHLREPDIALFSYLGRLEEIYDPSFWFNPGHMNGKGARLFSRRLGRDFAAWALAREGR
jgi:hypothetical protein